jgi:RNA polymerase sigma-70 factor (ECF subfamily)
MRKSDAGEWNGDWRGLLSDYGPRLLLFARQQSRCPAEAEDIVQEAFVKFWQSRKRRPQLEPALLFTIVKRLAIDRARSRDRRMLREEASRSWLEDDSSWFETPAQSQEHGELLESSLRKLPQEQREVLVLKIWGELTFEEIGRTIGASPNTAASRYRYALNRLKRQLTPSLA